MGRLTWQWLALSLVLCAAPVFLWSTAFGEDTSDTCPDGNCPYLEPESEETDKEDAKAKSKEEEPLPLELGVGTTAGSKSSDPLANGGVTVVKDGDAKPKETTPKETEAAGAAALIPVTPPMWTPNTDRFLLKDRQDTLSLTTEVDTTDKGDFSHFPEPKAQTPRNPVRRTTPAAKPQPQPRQESIQPQNEVENPVEIETDEVLDPGAGMISNLGLPENGDGSGTSPREHFLITDGLDAPGSDSYLVGDTQGGGDPGSGAPGIERGNPGVGVINARGVDETPPPGSPSLADVLNGQSEDENLGSSFAGVSMGRSLAIMLGMVALLFLMFGAAKYFKGGFKPAQQLPLSVMETISLGSGRQITIMEMGDNALILGVTPQSINLLDKVPLGLINASYQGTVNAIIDKESKALPDDWAQRPQFTVPDNTRPAQLVPPLASAGTYGPSGQRVNVSDLRKARSGGATATRACPSTTWTTASPGTSRGSG